ncbi:MAG: hypothetical protein PVI23_12990 [Maricaulaceae bacterium]|jgi:hypothetical protein
MKSSKLTIAAVAAALAIGACDDLYDDNGGGYTPPPPPPPPPATPLEDTFGTGFGTAFRADPNTDPVDPMAGDIVALDLTADPTEIPDPS